MRIDKNIGVKVTIHKDRKYLGSIFNGFNSIGHIKSWVRSNYKENGIVHVTASQDGGYHKSFNINTN